MGLTKKLLDENFYYNHNQDIRYVIEYQEYCFEQEKAQNQKASRICGKSSGQNKVRSFGTIHGLRKQQNKRK